VSRLVALVGISGVGKSFALRELSNRISIDVLQASTLIREARKGQAKATHDNLRALGIDENQALLVAEFHRRAQHLKELIVLDGHTGVDTGTDLVDIAPQVFAAMGVASFIFLADDPEKIAARRTADTSRQRPQRDAASLSAHQERALASALRSAISLRIPVTIATADRLDVVEQTLTQLGATRRHE